MKKVFLSALILFGILSCNLDDPVPDYTKVKSQFKLYDITGVEKYTFKSGENFEMRFTITNNSGADLTYQYTPPDVIYKIYQSDSLISSSTDGMAYTQVFITTSIKNGITFKSSWIAPNSLGRIPKISLQAGNYKAVVVHGCFFSNYKLAATEPVEFTVVN